MSVTSLPSPRLHLYYGVAHVSTAPVRKLTADPTRHRVGSFAREEVARRWTLPPRVRPMDQPVAVAIRVLVLPFPVPETSCLLPTEWPRESLSCNCRAPGDTGLPTGYR